MKKKLYKNKKDGIFAGVCQGLGEYFGISPWIFRVLFILPVLPFILTFFAGVISVLLYIVLANVMKDKDAAQDKVIEVEYEVLDEDEKEN
ncbi:MAG: PspC domain-containing protein [Eubacterium sp.]|nr:PspC domain-containing protein [Eubacterium sp.]